MGRRTLLMIASILVAALGTALIWLYVQGADTRAAAQEVDVPVLVATGPVSAGTPAAQVRVRQATLPQSLVASLGPGVLTDMSVVSGAFAKTDIVPGLPLLAGQFAASPPRAAPALDALPPNEVAIQVTLPDPQRLAGLLQPQSRVRIYASIPRGGTKATVTLFNAVQVLASGPVTDAAGTVTKAVPQAIVTLALSNDQAKQLVFAQGAGANLQFALLGTKVPPDDNQPVTSIPDGAQ